MHNRIRFGGAIFACVLAGTTGAFGAAFDRACEQNHTADVCACSKKLLMSRLDMKEFAFYAVAVKAAMDNEAAGMSAEDAWDAASDASDASAKVLAADMVGKSDEFRAVHQNVLEECGG